MRIEKIIRLLGREVLINGTKARAVIYPVRNGSSRNGGIGSDSSGRLDPHLFYMFADRALTRGAGYAGIVSDGTDEYYILWADVWKSSSGEYMKVCMKKTEVRS